MPNALITGASAGLGRALATALAVRGWGLVIDGRRPDVLDRAAEDLRAAGGTVTALAGDVTDDSHRRSLVAAAEHLGGLDLLVNNASTLGPTPLREVWDLSPSELAVLLDVNVVAPLALIAGAAPLLASTAIVINVSSDAAVEHYPQWGAYGASKAALDHLTATLAVEEPQLRWYAVDPGDMNTDLQAAASPGEDISDRRLPGAVVPAFLDLLDRRPPSGRYVAGEGRAVPSDSPRGGDIATSGDTHPPQETL